MTLDYLSRCYCSGFQRHSLRANGSDGILRGAGHLDEEMHDCGQEAHDNDNNGASNGVLNTRTRPKLDEEHQGLQQQLSDSFVCERRKPARPGFLKK